MPRLQIAVGGGAREDGTSASGIWLHQFRQRRPPVFPVPAWPELAVEVGLHHQLLQPHPTALPVRRQPAAKEQRAAGVVDHRKSQPEALFAHHMDAELAAWGKTRKSRFLMQFGIYDTRRCGPPAWDSASPTSSSRNRGGVVSYNSLSACILYRLALVGTNSKRLCFRPGLGL